MWDGFLGMSLRSMTLVAFLLVIGCATNEKQSTAARAETGIKKAEIVRSF